MLRDVRACVISCISITIIQCQVCASLCFFLSIESMKVLLSCSLSSIRLPESNAATAHNSSNEQQKMLSNVHRAWPESEILAQQNETCILCSWTRRSFWYGCQVLDRCTSLHGQRLQVNDSSVFLWILRLPGPAGCEPAHTARTCTDYFMHSKQEYQLRTGSLGRFT